MPTDFWIDCEHGVVMTTIEGAASLQELLDARGRLKAHADFSPSDSQLVDMRNVDWKNVEVETFRGSAKASVFNKGTRRAMVVNTDVAFGLARMYQTLADDLGQEVQVFRSIDEARAWLGLGPEGRD